MTALPLSRVPSLADKNVYGVPDLPGVFQVPRKSEHIGFALIAQLTVELLKPSTLQDSDRFWDVVGACLGASFGGVLPDILEPALTPNHRQFAHGIIPAAAAAHFGRGAHREGCDSLYTWAHEAIQTSEETCGSDDSLPRSLRFLIAGFFRGVPIGYLSHLVADFGTPRCLPLVGRL